MPPNYDMHALGCAGGALSRGNGASTSKADLVKVPPCTLGGDLSQLLASGAGADITFVVEDPEGGQGLEEVFNVHKIILEARSPVFR